MRIFHDGAERFVELDDLPDALPAGGYLWIGSARRGFEVDVPSPITGILGMNFDAIPLLTARPPSGWRPA